MLLRLQLHIKMLNTAYGFCVFDMDCDCTLTIAIIIFNIKQNYGTFSGDLSTSLFLTFLYIT